MVHSLLSDKNLDQVHVLALDYEENYHQEQNHCVCIKKKKKKESMKKVLYVRFDTI